MPTSVKFYFDSSAHLLSVPYSFIIPQDSPLSNKIFENQKIFLKSG